MGLNHQFMLRPNGDEIPVTGANRELYISLLCKFLLKSSCYNPYDMFVLCHEET